MRINLKKYILWLLGISLGSAILSDTIYGKAEFAGEYLIGQFIGEIFRVTISLAVVLCIVWFLFRVVFQDFFKEMFFNPRLENGKEIIKTKRGKTSSRKIRRK